MTQLFLSVNKQVAGYLSESSEKQEQSSEWVRWHQYFASDKIEHV